MYGLNMERLTKRLNKKAYEFTNFVTTYTDGFLKNVQYNMDVPSTYVTQASVQTPRNLLFSWFWKSLG